MADIMKYSRQRECLLNILKHTNSHPTADWLYREMQKEIPDISLGTIYRNLKQLSKNHEILKLDVGTGSEHYDACTRDHNHFVCRTCGAVYDLDSVSFPTLDASAQETSEHRIDGHSLTFFGICSDCMAD